MKISAKILFACFFCIAFCGQSKAQFSGIINKAKQKANEKAERAIDNALDGKKKAESSESKAGESSTKKTSKISINQTFDFKAGDSVILHDNFRTDAEGKMASGWKTNGSGEVVTSSELQGKWLQLKSNSTYKLAKLITYPSRFTVEFDLLVVGDKVDDLHPAIFGFASDNSVRSYIGDAYNGGAVTGVSLAYFNRHGITESSSDTKYNHETDFDLSNYANQIMHVSIAVDGQNQQVYIDKQKISDTKMFNTKRLKYFYISAPLKMKNESKLLFGNYKVTTFKN